MSDVLQVEKKNGIAYLTMNRPDKLNAFSPELISALVAALRDADEDDEVKAVILSGAGRAFCAGGDIDGMKGKSTPKAILASIKRTSEITQTIVAMNKYVISAVHGYAAGAGFSLALAADFVIADKDAVFIASFTNIGLAPDLGLTKLLAERVPPAIAKEWLSSAKRVGAQEAYDRGIANRLADGNVVEEATEFAEFIVNGPPIANQFIKHLINNANLTSHSENIIQESIFQSLAFQTEDMKEGVDAFKAKRKPQFKGE